MAIPDDVKQADCAFADGYLYEAREFFADLLNNTDDPVYERIAENRLTEIDRQIRTARKTASFEIESEEEQGFFVCGLKIAYQIEGISGVVNDLFYNSHKKNYPDTSSIHVYHKGTQQVEIELTGHGKDERCEWCKLFRKNLIYYIGKKHIVRQGRCPLGITEE